MELFDREFNEMVERHVLEGMFYDGILIADINGIVRYIKNYINDAVPYDVSFIQTSEKKTALCSRLSKEYRP